MPIRTLVTESLRDLRGQRRWLLVWYLLMVGINEGFRQLSRADGLSSGLIDIRLNPASILTWGPIPYGHVLYGIGTHTPLLVGYRIVLPGLLYAWLWQRCLQIASGTGASLLPGAGTFASNRRGLAFMKLYAAATLAGYAVSLILFQLLVSPFMLENFDGPPAGFAWSPLMNSFYLLLFTGLTAWFAGRWILTPPNALTEPWDLPAFLWTSWSWTRRGRVTSLVVLTWAVLLWPYVVSSLIKALLERFPLSMQSQVHWLNANLAPHVVLVASMVPMPVLVMTGVRLWQSYRLQVGISPQGPGSPVDMPPPSRADDDARAFGRWGKPSNKGT